MFSHGHVFAFACLVYVCDARRVQTQDLGSDFTHVSQSLLETRHSPPSAQGAAPSRVGRAPVRSAQRLFDVLSMKRREKRMSQIQHVTRIKGGRIEATEDSPHLSSKSESGHIANVDGLSSLSSKLETLVRLRAGATTPLWNVVPAGFFVAFVWSLLTSHGEKTSQVLEKIDTVGSIIFMFFAVVAVSLILRIGMFGPLALRNVNAAVERILDISLSTSGLAGIVSFFLLLPVAMIVGLTLLPLDLLIECAPVMLLLSPALYFLWLRACRYVSPLLIRRLNVLVGRTTVFTLLGILLYAPRMFQ